LVASGKNGLLSTPNRTSDFAYNIRILLRNTILRKNMGQNAFNYANQFSWEAINGTLLSNYQNILLHYYSLN
jgi:glycosyltransferase involved in cell wall biosynthesis